MASSQGCLVMNIYGTQKELAELLHINVILGWVVVRYKSLPTSYLKEVILVSGRPTSLESLEEASMGLLVGLDVRRTKLANDSRAYLH